MGQSKMSPRIAKARIRELKALELRAEGLRYWEIGQELGVTESTAYKLVRRALQRNLEKQSEAAEALLQIQNERIERMIAAVWSAAEDGKLGAVDRVNALMARQAKLNGLDAPDRLKVSGDKDNPHVIELVWPEDE